jgi:hypothetical protein
MEGQIDEDNLKAQLDLFQPTAEKECKRKRGGNKVPEAPRFDQFLVDQFLGLVFEERPTEFPKRKLMVPFGSN